MKMKVKSIKRRKKYTRPPELETIEKTSLELQVEELGDKPFCNVMIHRNSDLIHPLPLTFLREILYYTSSTQVLFNLFLTSSKVKGEIEDEFYDSCENIRFIVTKKCRDYLLRKKLRYVFHLELAHVKHPIFIKLFPSLRSLVVKNCENVVKYNRGTVDEILGGIEYLYLQNVNFSEFLGKLKSLRRLRLSYCFNYDIFASEKKFFEFLTPLKNLSEIHFEICASKEEKINISRIDSLENLTILQCENLSFSSLPKLKNLRLKNLDQVNKEMFTDLPNLEELEIFHCQSIENDCLLAISQTLKMLCIDTNQDINQNLFNHDWKELKKLKLIKCDLSGEYLFKLRDILEVLEIEECPNIMDVHLRNLRELKELSIVKCSKIKDQSQFQNLSKIRVFRLWANNRIGDTVLLNFPELEVLEVGNCPKILGIMFRALTKLRELRLFGLNGIADNYLFEEIKEEDFTHDDLKISFDEVRDLIVDRENVRNLFKNLTIVEICDCPNVSKPPLLKLASNVRHVKLKNIRGTRQYELKRLNIFSKTDKEYMRKDIPYLLTDFNL